jgi:hypothetical protein
MISKNLYVNIVIRVLLIVSISAWLGWWVAGGGSLRISLICLLVLGILTVNLISYLNSTNKKIRYFFDAKRFRYY